MCKRKIIFMYFLNFQNYMSHSSIGFLYMKKYVVSYIWWTSTCSILILFIYLVPSLHRCQRLGLTSLAYLWRRDQEELLKEMIDSQLTAVLIKVASLGKNNISYNFGWLFVNILCVYCDCVNYIHEHDLLKLLICFSLHLYYLSNFFF